MDNRFDTFGVVNNPLAFSGLYAFQLELDKFYSKEIYIDSSDYIAMILGINDVYDLEQNFNTFLVKSKMAMLRGLMYRNHLGTLRLLNPHMFEFLNKELPSDPRTMAPLIIHNPDDVIHKLQLVNPSDEEINDMTIEGVLPFYKLEKEAEARFVMMGLIDQGHPKKRAVHLVKSKILSFDTDQRFNVANLTEKKIFKKLLQVLNEIAEERSINNYFDALALTQLQLLFEEYEQKSSFTNEKRTIPLLYARSRVIKAVGIVAEVKDLLSDGKKPFTFYGNSGEHLIVQNEDFFLLDALYSIRKTQKTEHFEFADFFSEISEYYTIARKEIDENRQTAAMVSPENSKQKETVQKALHLQFFRKWWREDQGLQDLRKSLVKLNALNEQKIAKEKFNYIEVEFERTYKNVEQTAFVQNLGLKYAHIAFRPDFMKAITNKYSEAGVLQYDIEQEFVTRFSYPLESVKAIKKFVEKLYSSYQEKNSTVNDELKVRIITHLQHVMDYNVLRVDRTLRDREKFNDLCVMLSILWIENHYGLLDEFCLAIRRTFDLARDNNGNLYPNYQIALLHATCLIRNQIDNGALDFEAIEEILICILSKYENSTYKLWIGLSFVYAKMWEATSQKTSIPEIDSITRVMLGQDVLTRHNFYFKSKDYAKRAIEYIRGLKEIPEKKLMRERRLHYAINNYIYMETLNRPLQEFPGDLDFMIRDLESAAASFLQHERYQDTIARYNQRMAAKCAIENPYDVLTFQGYVDSAIRLCKTSIDEAKRKHNEMDLPLYQSLFNELDRMRIQGVGYFNFNINKL